MKNRNTIEITEDLRLPGTDVILEAGDRIEVMKESTYIPPDSRGKIVRFVRKDLSKILKEIEEGNGYDEQRAGTALLEFLEGELHYLLGDNQSRVEISWGQFK